jgi:hypothetical protein
VINHSYLTKGQCNDLKDKYVIYIIDDKKLFENKQQNEYWQTYRRFNDFYDFHLIIKKKVIFDILIETQT